MKAIALVSGGLDSLLAARLIQGQGLEVIALNFKIPFCASNKGNSSLGLFADLGIPLKTVDISADFLEMIKKPRHGFGSQINPCIDCKILMLRKAKELMFELKAKFIVTGEVLGQRPMSQHRQALAIIEKDSGLTGLLLRPLSARLLGETFPETQGWVKRENLLDFNGRGRKSQIALAGQFNIRGYANPAGGCLLTDPRFSQRVRDLLEHQALSLNNTELLKIGRHFRISPKAKLIVGRDEKENEALLALCQEGDYLFEPRIIAGPTSLGRGDFDAELIKLSLAITCRYCDLAGSSEAELVYLRKACGQQALVKVSPILEEKLLNLRI